MNLIEDARYRESTQFRLWSYSRADLASLRSKTNALAKSHISTRLTSSPSPTVTPVPNQPPAQQNAPPDFLTPEEEAELLRYFTVELLNAAAFCELPTEIRATAAVHFRRFYLTNSVMTYSPTEIMKTCLFFGSKSEGFYTRLSKFAEKLPNTTPEQVVAGEYLLCQGIRFCFDVRHPFRALEGAILDLRRIYPDEIERIDQAHARARHILKFSPLITDAYFHYTPSQIMLAALSMADEELAFRLLSRSFDFTLSQKNMNGGAETKVEEEALAALQEKIVQTVKSCREMMETEPPERMDGYWGKPECHKVIRPLLKKLKKCRDPDRADLVALQRARREHAVRASQQKAGIKKEDDGAVFGGEPLRKKIRVEEEDPFGPAL